MSTVTTNMNLELPEVGTTPVAEAASQLVTALESIDTHNHSSGSGVQITPAGMNINDSVDFNNNAITDVASVTLYDNVSAPAGGGSNRNKVSAANGELYFTDGSGVPIQITSGGGLDITVSGGWTGDYSSSAAEAKYTAVSTTFKLLQDGINNQAGILDIGDIKLRTTTAGVSSYITLKSPTLGGSYTITFPTAAPASTSVVTMNSAGTLANTRALSIDSVTTTGAGVIGATLGVSGATTLSSTLGVTDAATLSSTLGVTGAATLSSTLGVTGATTLSSTLGVTGTTTLSSTLGVTGATTLSSTLAVTGAATLYSSLDVTGATALSSTLGVTGATTLSSTLGVTGTSTLGRVAAQETAVSTLSASGATVLSTLSATTTVVSGTITSTGIATVAGLESTGNTNLNTNLTVNGFSLFEGGLTAEDSSVFTDVECTSLYALGDIDGYTITATTSGIITGAEVGYLKLTGEVSHPTRYLSLAATSGQWDNAKGYFLTFNAKASSASADFFIGLPLRKGDIVTSIKTDVYATSGSTKTFELRRWNLTTGLSTTLATTTSSTSGGFILTHTLSTPYEIATDDVLSYKVTTAAINDLLRGFIVSYYRKVQ